MAFPGVPDCRAVAKGPERELAARELIAQLVKGLPIVLKTEAQRMLASYPADVIDDLPIRIGDNIGAIPSAIPKAAPDVLCSTRWSRVKGNIWNSPRCGFAAFKVRNSQGANHVSRECRQQSGRVVEVAIAESCFVDNVGRNGPGV